MIRLPRKAGGVDYVTEPQPSLLADFSRVIVYGVVSLVVSLGIVYLLAHLVFVGAPLFSSPCTTETLGKTSGVSGYDFEFRGTACHVIAADESVTVLASKPGQTRQTPLYKYDPGSSWVLPIITPVDRNTVRISL